MKLLVQKRHDDGESPTAAKKVKKKNPTQRIFIFLPGLLARVAKYWHVVEKFELVLLLSNKVGEQLKHWEWKNDVDQSMAEVQILD